MSIELNDLTIDTSDTVYKPREDSYLLLEVAKKEYNDSSVIEIGSGTGLSILSLAKNSPFQMFLALDLNYNAAKLTGLNARNNRIENCMVICGNLLSPFRKRGVPRNIIFNPPYLPADPEYDKLLSNNELVQFVGGENGYELTSHFISQLEDDHILLIILSSLASTPKEFSKMHPEWIIDNVTSRNMDDGEILWVLKFRRVQYA